MRIAYTRQYSRCTAAGETMGIRIGMRTASAWSGFIRPETILEQVRNTAPFLVLPHVTHRDRPADCGAGPDGFLRILAASAWLDESAPPDCQHEDYFALCLAAHHATVATYVPTDVDSKIRGLLWRQIRDRDSIRRLFDLTIRAHSWDLATVSRRVSWVTGFGPVSGHDGEWLSVAAGALGRLLTVGDAEYAERASAAIDAELRREAAAFLHLAAQPGREIETMRLVMSITHNLGDLDQGLSFWDPHASNAAWRSRFSRLAHENTRPYGGAFQLIARLYKDNLASEGHRHYPLRSVRPLRRSAELLLPLGPCLDEWGALVATHPLLSADDRMEVLDALIRGCRKIPGQMGYYRAIAGFRQADVAAFERAASLLPNSSRKDLREPAMQRFTSLPARSFESPLVKKVTAIRASAACLRLD